MRTYILLLTFSNDRFGINRKWKAESVRNCVKKEASYIKICRWVSVNGVMLPLFVRDAFGIRSGYVQFRPIPMLKWGVFALFGLLFSGIL